MMEEIKIDEEVLIEVEREILNVWKQLEKFNFKGSYIYIPINKIGGDLKQKGSSPKGFMITPTDKGQLLSIGMDEKKDKFLYAKWARDCIFDDEPQEYSTEWINEKFHQPESIRVIFEITKEVLRRATDAIKEAVRIRDECSAFRHLETVAKELAILFTEKTK